MKKLVMLIGEDVSKSYSMDMHNAAFKALSLDVEYVPLNLRPEEGHRIGDVFKSKDVIGANVTMPYKEKALSYVECLTERAKIIKAVNLIYYGAEGKLVGDNTDSFALYLSLSNRNWNKSSATIFGAGGVCRACVGELAMIGVKKIHIFNRTPERAKALVDDIFEFKGQFGISDDLDIEIHDLRGLGIIDQDDIDEVALERLSKILLDTSLVINATSRSERLINEKVVHDVFSKNKDIIVCDLIYRPVKTDLITQAQAHGLMTINGLELLLNQAIPSFERWTNVAAPKEIMANSLSLASGVDISEIVYK